MTSASIENRHRREFIETLNKLTLDQQQRLLVAMRALADIAANNRRGRP